MKNIKYVYEKMGAFLVDRLRLDQPEKGNRDLRQDLVSLRAVSKETIRDYYIRKISVLLMVMTAGLMLTVLSFLVCRGEGHVVEDQRLMRPGYGEGDRREELAVQIEGKEELEELEITVWERKYTEQEKQSLIDRAIAELEMILPGENESLDEVRTNLIFPQSMENGAVTVSWITIPYGVLGEDGAILDVEEENGILVELEATLTCGGRESVYTAYAKVFPPKLTEEEALQRSIQRKVEQANVNGSSQETMKLPQSAGGRKLEWRYPRENPFLTVAALALLALVGLYLQMDNQIHKRAEERKNQLLLDYPDLMWKMTMLLGAGLSIKGTFSRISEQYQREKTASFRRQKKGGADRKIFPGKTAKSRNVRYVYEEVTYACYEMESGIPEAEAYERFGRRCQLPEYIRLGSVLSQNLKKGARGLTALLETEAAASLTDRKNHARKISERAGTKLLLPMILMLGIVLAVLMVPAMLSF